MLRPTRYPYTCLKAANGGAFVDTQPLRSHRRILTASIVGTAVEYYDFYLYGYAAALVFGPLFFPVKSAAAQTLLALVSFGLAFVARPIGAITFGHFGDRIGRKSMLIATMLLMGICTLAIAFIPTYATAMQAICDMLGSCFPARDC